MKWPGSARLAKASANSSSPYEAPKFFVSFPKMEVPNTELAMARNKPVMNNRSGTLINKSKAWTT